MSFILEQQVQLPTVRYFSTSKVFHINCAQGKKFCILYDKAEL
jgi:hypothetical protein